MIGANVRGGGYGRGGIESYGRGGNGIERGGMRNAGRADAFGDRPPRGGRGMGFALR